jgi:hypothetical protein
MSLCLARVVKPLFGNIGKKRRKCLSNVYKTRIRMSKRIYVVELLKSSQNRFNEIYRYHIELNTLMAGGEGIVVGKMCSWLSEERNCALTSTFISVDDVIDCDDFFSQEDRANSIGNRSRS